MEKVLDAGAGDNLRAVDADDVPTLDAVAREGARRMLETALEAEVARYIEAHEEVRDTDGRRLVVRNGRGQVRTVTCGAGTMEVRAPRVNDRRVDEDGERRRFTSGWKPGGPAASCVLPWCWGGVVSANYLEGRWLPQRQKIRCLSPQNSEGCGFTRWVLDGFQLRGRALLLSCGIGFVRSTSDVVPAVRPGTVVQVSVGVARGPRPAAHVGAVPWRRLAARRSRLRAAGGFSARGTTAAEPPVPGDGRAALAEEPLV